MEILGQPPALVGSKSYPGHLHPQRSIGALEEPARVHHGNAPLNRRVRALGGTTRRIPIPVCSMYGIFSYSWVILVINVGKYSIHCDTWRIWDLNSCVV
jgi:hypothetical protein